MQINVAQLLREAVGATREYRINEAVDFNGDGNVSQVNALVKLVRTPRSILAQVTAETELNLKCSRCLSQFPFRVITRFEEEYSPKIDVFTGVSLPRPDEPGAFIIDEHHILDLTEAVRQYVVLNTPMKPLCNESCPGLCQSCGRNLNDGPCACPAGETDPRWAKLTKML